jgi:cytidine deaminase
MPVLNYFIYSFMESFTLLHRTQFSDDVNVLVRKAEDSLTLAYAPYSSFHVAAALLLENGVIVTGTNQENAAFPSGMCAERVALYAAASQYPGIAIRKMVVVARRSGSDQLAPATSCGSCRQVMLEFEQRQADPYEIVMLCKPDVWLKAKSAESLLPYSFAKESMHSSGDSD